MAITDPQPSRLRRRADMTRRDLTAVLADGAMYSLMVGLGETYFIAFALAIHIGEIPAGLVASVPMVLGGILQLSTPWCVRRLGSHKVWVVICATLQAVSLALMPLAVSFERWAIWFIYGAATLYWAAGLATNPAWSAWVEGIVPKFVRTHFFARRVRLSQAGSLFGFVAGGLALQFGKSFDQVLLAFTSVFLVAAAARFISAACLASQSEPSTSQFTKSEMGLGQVFGRLRGHSGAKLFWYLFAVQVAVQVSGPYFSPFMLRQLGLSYVEFMLLVAFGFIGKVVSMPLWGRVAYQYGARTLLWIGGVAIIPVAGAWMGLWIVPQRFLFLGIVQFSGGMAWAAYELAFFLMFFEAIPRRERTSLLTLYNFGNAASLGIGSLLGAVWLSWMGENQTAYLSLFGISSLLRACALVLLWRVPRAAEPIAELVEPISVIAAVEPQASAPLGPVVDPEPIVAR